MRNVKDRPSGPALVSGGIYWLANGEGSHSYHLSSRCHVGNKTTKETAARRVVRTEGWYLQLLGMLAFIDKLCLLLKMK